MSREGWNAVRFRELLEPFVAELRSSAQSSNDRVDLLIERGSRSLHVPPWERQMLAAFDRPRPGESPEVAELVVLVNAIVLRMIDDLAKFDTARNGGTGTQPPGGAPALRRELPGLTRARFRENVDLGAAALAEIRRQLGASAAADTANLEPKLGPLRVRLRDRLAEIEKELAPVQAVSPGGRTARTPAASGSFGVPAAPPAARLPEARPAPPRAGRSRRALLSILAVSIVLAVGWYGIRAFRTRAIPLKPVALADFASVPEVVGLETKPPEARLELSPAWRKLQKDERRALLLKIGTVFGPRGFRKVDVVLAEDPGKVVGTWYAGGGLTYERFN